MAANKICAGCRAGQSRQFRPSGAPRQAGRGGVCSPSARPREGRGPGDNRPKQNRPNWIPACAGMSGNWPEEDHLNLPSAAATNGYRKRPTSDPWRTTMSRKVILTLATAATITASALACSAADARGFGGGGGMGRSVGIGRIGGGGGSVTSEVSVASAASATSAAFAALPQAHSRSYCRPASTVLDSRPRGGCITIITGIGGSTTAVGSPSRTGRLTLSSLPTSPPSPRPAPAPA
jgi:hypothetical protein